MLNNSDKVLVTGGAGFIGSHLVSALLQRGLAVRVLEKPGASVKHLPQNNIEIVWADITKRESLTQAI